MIGESYFMALAGLGISLAGFAGLISALDHRPDAHTAVAAWRIRNIAVGGFTVMFAGLATVALFQVTGGNQDMTVRLASLLLALANLRPLWNATRPAGSAWPSARGRAVAISIAVGLATACVANVFIGGLGYLQFLFLLQLTGPASIFLNTVRDVASGV